MSERLVLLPIYHMPCGGDKYHTFRTFCILDHPCANGELTPWGDVFNFCTTDSAPVERRRVFWRCLKCSARFAVAYRDQENGQNLLYLQTPLEQQQRSISRWIYGAFRVL